MRPWKQEVGALGMVLETACRTDALPYGTYLFILMLFLCNDWLFSVCLKTFCGNWSVYQLIITLETAKPSQRMQVGEGKMKLKIRTVAIVLSTLK